jgi:hypothetical protein
MDARAPKLGRLRAEHREANARGSRRQKLEYEQVNGEIAAQSYGPL